MRQSSFEMCGDDQLDLLWADLSGANLQGLPVRLEPARPTTRYVGWQIKHLALRIGASNTRDMQAICGALAASENRLALAVRGHSDSVDIHYITEQKTGDTHAGLTLKRALKAHFPGAEFFEERFGGDLSEVIGLSDSNISGFGAVGCLGAVPQARDESDPVGPLARFITAMSGRSYLALWLAEPLSVRAVEAILSATCSIYTQLSPFREHRFQQTQGVALQHSMTETEGWTRGISRSVSEGLSTTHTIGSSSAKGRSHTGTVGGSFSQSVTVGGSFTPLGVGVSGSTTSQVSVNTSYAYGRSTTETESESSSDTQSKNTTSGTSEGKSGSHGQTSGKSITENVSIGHTEQNRAAHLILDHLEKRVQRLDKARAHGVWRSGCYLLADNVPTVATGLGILQGLFLGEESSSEAVSRSIWAHTSTNNTNHDNAFVGITRALLSLRHPVFNVSTTDVETHLSPTVLLSGPEVATYLAPPCQSVPGMPVSIHPDFGLEPTYFGGPPKSEERLELGKARAYGQDRDQATVKLDVQSLTGHTLVVGATGSGKSNTTRRLLSCLRKLEEQVPFLVIEPVKNEYRCLAVGKRAATLYTAGEPGTDWVCINPLRFPNGVHILTHIDRLTQLFNAAFPMYASMPALLEEATRRAYEAHGWDLATSRCRGTRRFPTFVGILHALKGAVEEAGYSDRVEADFVGALSARLRSLTRGLRGELLCPLPGDEIPDAKLFENNVVINLRAIASPETKALVMGALLIRLREYREASDDAPLPAHGLRHMTVLEEAHTLLRRTNIDVTQEGANLRGMAVEMFTDAIAELRSAGEGFLIVDQSPTTLDVGVIKHTNTKIIHRLPHESDRHEAAAAVGASDLQAHELGRLPTGAAVVYQNDWLEPVMCGVSKVSDRTWRSSSEPIIHRWSRRQILIWIALSTRSGLHASHVDTLLRSMGTSRVNAARMIAYRLGTQEVEGSIDLLFEPESHSTARDHLIEVWNGRNAPEVTKDLLLDGLLNLLELSLDADLKSVLDKIREGADPIHAARAYLW